MEHTISDGVAVMSPEARKLKLPALVVRLVLGETVLSKYMGKKDVVGVVYDGDIVPFHSEDYRLASVIAERLKLQWVDICGRKNTISSASNLLKLLEVAQGEVLRETDSRQGKRGIVMLADNDGSSFWRMRLPARYMKLDGMWADITSTQVSYDQLLEYAVVFVQRFHEWDSYYILKKLKDGGRRIVYDIDDDLFSIPKDNPASRVIGKDQQMAAAETMRIADVVTASTEELASRLRQIEGLENKVVVIPNALDVSDGWRPTPLTGSPDGWKRIFWQGGSTHAEDWMECIEAVEQVMEEDERVRLTVLGFLPPVVMDMAMRRSWQGRIEYMGFSAPETYYKLVKHVVADVGLAPLQQTHFNGAKSELKFMENTLIGMPTVASRVTPYLDVIDDGISGKFATGRDEWVEAIKFFLNDKRKRQAVLAAARQVVTERFDICKTAEQWRKAIVG